MENNKPYDHVIPDIEEWPIYRLSEDRRRFIEEIDQFILDRFMRKPVNQVTDIISKTIYQERIRMKEDPWKVEPSQRAPVLERKNPASTAGIFAGQRGGGSEKEQ